MAGSTEVQYAADTVRNLASIYSAYKAMSFAKYRTSGKDWAVARKPRFSGTAGVNYVPRRLQTGRAQVMGKGRYRRVGFYGRFGGQFNRSAFPYRPELKFHDASVLGVNLDIGGTLVPVGGSINLIGTGVTESTRVGRRLTIRNIRFSGSVILPAASGSTINTFAVIRIILYLDQQCNGAPALPSDLIDFAGAEQAVYSPRTIVNQGRFRFLFDRVFMLNLGAAAGNGTANDSAPVRRHFLMQRNVSIPLEFCGITGAITELATNNFCVLGFSHPDGVGQVTYNCRFRYSDA